MPGLVKTPTKQVLADTLLEQYAPGKASATRFFDGPLSA
jgi:hypothetical protein